MTAPLPTRADVLAAAEALRGTIVRTPVLRNPVLDELAGVELYFKCENLQHIGAFKARGAAYGIGRLGEEQRARGVITYSSGNHAQAVALAARRHGCRADIFMPIDAPEVKKARVLALGAFVTSIGTTSLERREAAMAFAAKSGGFVVEPFDHADTISGQGTATLELLEDAAALTDGAGLDAVVIPVGGGGLIAGACLACDGTGTRVFSVEPEGCDAMRQSLAAGERVPVEPGTTLADGLKPTMVGERNFAIARAHVADSFVVGDRELGRAVVALLLHAKVLAEPSGAAGLAAVLGGALPGDARRVGVMLCGGNVAPGVLNDLIAEHAESVLAAPGRR